MKKMYPAFRPTEFNFKPLFGATIFPYPHQTSEPTTVVIPPFMCDYLLGHLVNLAHPVSSIVFTGNAPL